MYIIILVAEHTWMRYLYISFLWAQVCDELIQFLNNQRDEKRSRYQAELGKCLKSCTDAASKHAEKQKQTLNEVNELKGEKESLHSWQEEAKPLM